ncbi:VOC family protein [Desulfosediminicola ganghwensis]|uniref:VOC family protein n=1 Tax=Desulfosediminicola ganghwensis TaxID=2569540 RepID=UPI0010ABEF61|nr:VOC family protein [Desulfosediminicola ganghwensis]
MSSVRNTGLDHLVIAAHTLEHGVNYVEKQLGVTLPYGGEHPKMGTHNHLARIGNDIFLEIIAINPAVGHLERPRWFNLDDRRMQQSLKECPRLISWVVNTGDLGSLLEGAHCSFGTPEPISRGELSWHFALPADGRLLGGGFLPYLIQWHVDSHPAGRMAEVGLRLKSLTLYHDNPMWLLGMLTSIGADRLVEVKGASGAEPQSIRAVFDTPLGEVELSSL